MGMWGFEPWLGQIDPRRELFLSPLLLLSSLLQGPQWTGFFLGIPDLTMVQNHEKPLW